MSDELELWGESIIVFALLSSKMNTVDNKAELEDGEINDLEDGEIEDDENYSINSRRQQNYSEVLPSSLAEEFQTQNAKRYPVRDRRRQRNEFDD